MFNLENLAEELGFEISQNVQASKLSTYRGGGVVKQLLYPKNAEQFKRILCELKNENCSVYLLGGGSNTLVSDGEICTPVVSTENLDYVTVDGRFVTCGAGVLVSRLVSFLQNFQLGGLEFLYGVPASVGGALHMNAGAFGQQIGDYVDNITTLNADCEQLVKMTKHEIEFGYRNGVQEAVIEAVFYMSEMDKMSSVGRQQNFVRQRAFKQPHLPSLGSVFKNSTLENIRPSAWYIERAGLKGRRCGGAQISEMHANFIVNNGSGNATDFITLVEIIEGVVFEKFGIVLEREFKLLR